MLMLVYTVLPLVLLRCTQSFFYSKPFNPVYFVQSLPDIVIKPSFNTTVIRNTVSVFIIHLMTKNYQ